jgi:hypothetical protein
VTDTFYFVAFVDNERATVQVIDLGYSVDYQRNHWSLVDDETFTDRDEAIAHGRALATVNGLTYEPFESRYDKSLNEPKLSLTSPRIKQPFDEAKLKALYERTINAAILMNDEEKDELAAWKQENDSCGHCAIIDWPGWDSVFDRVAE